MTNSDMRISGSGTIPAGEYQTISISGSGKGSGDIRCESLHISGSAHLQGHVTCHRDIRISGSAHVDGAVQTHSIQISGSCKLGQDLDAEESVLIAGACKLEGSLRTKGELKSAGSLTVQQNIEAERVQIKGHVTCPGLLNAEDIFIQRQSRSSTCEIGSIGGGHIRVCLPESPLPSWKFWKRTTDRMLCLQVQESIEGDEIDLEYTKAGTVTGKRVRIGAGCEIGVVRYTEQADIDPDAIVHTLEKAE